MEKQVMQGKLTYTGLIVALAPAIAQMLGYDLSEAFPVQFALLANEAITIIGAAVAWYGRARAQTPGWLAKK